MSETPSVAGYILKELPMTTKLTTSPGGGDSERLKKRGGSMVQGQVFL